MAIQKKQKQENLTAYLFLAPWIIGFIIFSGFPILASLVVSLTKWNMMNTPDFVGLANYVHMFTASPGFLNSLRVTLEYTLLSVSFTVAWSLGLAMLLNSILRGKQIFQFFYFIPAVIPVISLAFVFQIIFNQHTGIMNYIISLFGSKILPNWLFDTKLVMPTVVFISIYTYSTGQMMLIFKVSLSDVPKELYESAFIDGASSFQRFRAITLPMISPIILFNVVMASISSLNNSFSLLYPLTNGGPNDATNVLSLSIYSHAFSNHRMGYASALALVLFCIAAALAFIQLSLSKKWIHYAE